MKIFPPISSFLVILFCWSSLSAGHAEEFEPAEFVLDDHAALIPVLEGTRRVRVSYRDDSREWQVYSLAHLAGDEGQIKLRLPDGISSGDICIEVSMTDPFPYEVYAGRSDFVTESDGTLSLQAPLASDRAGAGFGAEDATASPPVVQESDLWKWKGRILYFYNQLRGLQVYDFSDPANPWSMASLRMPALGEDMYLHPDGEHLILLAKRWAWGEESAGSEAVVIQHSSRGLEIMNRIPLPGNSVVESRMVGSHLYVAMRSSRRIETLGEDGQPLVQWETGLTVVHANLTEPGNPVTDAPLNLFSKEGWWYQAVVSATPEYLLIAPAVYDRNTREYQSTVHLIDIRDQTVPLHISASVPLQGHLKDKFKLRVKDHILTCVTQGGRRGSSMKTVVATYDLGAQRSDGSIPLVDDLTLAPQETLFATRFDGDRLYVVTAIQIDPLFVVDLGLNGRLRLLGELKIPGWSHYLQPRGDRLLSLGVEDRRVAVSLFDVSDPSNMGPPRRIYLGEEGEYSWSEGNYDEQAIGYFPDKGILIVPFQSYGRDWQGGRTALQIIRFSDKSLEKAGIVETDFVARRATLLDEKTMVSASGRVVSALDVSELSNPQMLSSIEVAWPVDRVVSHEDYLLQIEGGNSGWHPFGQSRLGAVLRISTEENPDEVIARADLAGSFVAGAEMTGDDLHVLTTANEIEAGEEGESTWRQVVYHNVVDLSDPGNPIASKPGPLNLPELYGGFRGKTLENGLMAWLPESGNPNMPWWGIDFGIRGPFFYPQSRDVRIVIVDASDPVDPELVVDYRIDATSDGPAGDDTGEVDWDSTFSGMVEMGEKLFVSFRQSRWVSDEVGGRSHYETEHKLRVATLTGAGAISVAPAVSSPGTIEAVREVGDDSSWLLLSAAPAVRSDDVDRVWWSNDLVLQSSAFDGLTVYLIEEVVIPNAYHRSVAVIDDYFVVPQEKRDDVQGVRNVTFYPFDLQGEFGESRELEVGFNPNQLVFAEGVLSATGWSSDGQVWWMLNPVTLDQPEPATIEISSQFHVDLEHARFDLSRLRAWVPVGAYGVETVNLRPLFEETVLPGDLEGERAKMTVDPWVKYLLQSDEFAPAVATDGPGALVPEGIWRFRPSDTVSYSDWMARQIEIRDNPELELPPKDGDLDRDGVSNWAEFVFGTNPLVADSKRLHLECHPTKGGVEIEFEMPKGHEGGLWEVEVSEDLVGWKPVGITEMSVKGDGMHSKRLQLSIPQFANSGAVFLRLNAIR